MLKVHASQGLKVGLYTPTILGGNSYLSWFYDRGAIKDPAHTGTSKGLSQAINRGPIRKFLPKYANFYVTIQSHGLSSGARTHYVTANGVRNGLCVQIDGVDVCWEKTWIWLIPGVETGSPPGSHPPGGPARGCLDNCLTVRVMIGNADRGRPRVES